jgi:hypothetical protein
MAIGLGLSCGHFCICRLLHRLSGVGFVRSVTWTAVRVRRVSRTSASVVDLIERYGLRLGSKVSRCLSLLCSLAAEGMNPGSSDGGRCDDGQCSHTCV